MGPVFAFDGTGVLGLSRPDAPSELRWSGASAQERWNLVAAFARSSWDPLSPNPAFATTWLAPRFDRHHAFDGESAGGRLAFDWSRQAAGRQIDAAAFAHRASLAVRSDIAPGFGSALDERLQERIEQTRLGASFGVTGPGAFASIPSSQRLGVRVSGETRDARALLANTAQLATRDAQGDRVNETRVALDWRHDARPLRNVRVETALSLERFRLRVDSSGPAGSGATDGVLVSPAARLSWDLGWTTTAYAKFARGREGAQPLAAVGFRAGAAVPWLDPEWRRETTEAGLAARWGDLDARVYGWRATAPAELAFGAGGEAYALARPSERHGAGLALRYPLFGWLDLDAQALLARSRFADGSHEQVPGAAHAVGMAGATLRQLPKGWIARVFVSYLGPRDGLEEGVRLRSSSLVNAQVARRLSKNTLLSLDVFNVFDRRVDMVDSFSASRAGLDTARGESYLFDPTEARGFLVKLRTRF